jgi:poly(A) polymerase
MPRFEDHLELAKICGAGADGNLEAYNFAAELSRKWSPEDLWPPPLITGDDLIRMGFTPGPLFKQILTAVEDAQLEGRLKTPEQALDFVKGKYAL